MKKLLINAFLLLFIFPCAYAKRIHKRLSKQKEPVEVTQSEHLFKAVLSNGMTVLVRPTHQIPKVAMQVWYNVGSKDEKTGEKGIAHLIEHMIFKGTKEMLSESDIGTLMRKLSGSCNAATYYDWTFYRFLIPTQHWHEIMPIIADCMQNVRFDKNMLASEMKAVIQELKMRRDNYMNILGEEIISMMFADHPYHYPVIGFKQDLYHVSPEILHSFYKKHYCPNNATFVVVGDVDPYEVIAQAEEYFGTIPANVDYKKETFYHNHDLTTKAVTLYRDVKQPIAMLAWEVPGASKISKRNMAALELIMCNGHSSRLYKKLVHELQLVTSFTVYQLNFFDHGVFVMGFYPKNRDDIPKIEEIICDEFASIARDGVTIAECEKALKKMRMSQCAMLEDIEQQAQAIGENYLAMDDPEYIFNALNITPEALADEIQSITRIWFRSGLVLKGAVMPLAGEDIDLWTALQAESDKEDTAILAHHQRTTEVEPARYADTVEACMPDPFPFPKPQKIQLNNGLKLLWYVNDNTPQVMLILSLRAKSYYDAWNKQGLGNFVAKLLKEGTKKHSAAELADLIESRGISLQTHCGYIYITALKEDLSFALDIMYELLTEAAFEEASLEKVRAQILTHVKQYADDSHQLAWRLVKKNIYKDHPYAKDWLGTEESVKQFTRDDVVGYYAQYMSPDGARLAIVGDIGEYDMQELVQQYLGTWQGPKVPEMVFPHVPDTESQLITCPINRDQTVLAFAKKSVSRLDPQFDLYHIYTQIFGGGALGMRNTRLFNLREQSGLFYAASGNLRDGADEQPGICLVRAIVSNDRLDEAVNAIKNCIAHAHETLTQNECEEAKRAIINTCVDNFASNRDIAEIFLFLDRYNFPDDFFDNRACDLEPITAEQIKEVMATFMNPDDFIEVRVGRVE